MAASGTAMRAPQRGSGVQSTTHELVVRPYPAATRIKLIAKRTRHALHAGQLRPGHSSAPSDGRPDGRSWPIQAWRERHDGGAKAQRTYEPPTSFLASPATYQPSGTSPVTPALPLAPAQLPSSPIEHEQQSSWLDAVLARPAARLHADSREAVAGSLVRLAESRAVPSREELQELLGAVQLQLGALGLKEFERVAAALVKLGHRPDAEFMDEFDRELLGHIPNCTNPSAIASTLHSLARIGAQPSARLLHSCLHEALRQSDRLSLHSLSQLVWACARLGRQPGPAWLAAFAEATAHRLAAEAMVSKATADRLAAGAVAGRQAAGGPWQADATDALLGRGQEGNMPAAAAAAGVPGAAAMGLQELVIVPTATQQHSSGPLHPAHAVTPLSPLASLTSADAEYPASSLTSASAPAAPPAHPLPSTLTNMLWAHAKLRAEPNRQWLSSFHSALGASARGFAPGQLSLGLSALASWCSSGRLGRADAAPLLQLLLGEVRVKLGLMRPGDLATTLWSLARLDHQPAPDCMAELLDAAQGQLPRMAASQLAALAWALAKLQGKSASAAEPSQSIAESAQSVAESAQSVAESAQDFWDAFVLEVRAKLQAFSPAGLANVAWALGRLMRDPGEPFVSELWVELQNRSGSFSPHELSTLLWALARLQESPPAPWLFQQLTIMQPQLQHLSPQELAHTAWALAQLHHCGCPKPPPGFLAAVERVTEQLLFSFSLQELVMMLSGFSRLGHTTGKEWRARCVGELRARVSVEGGGSWEESEVGQLLTEAGLEGMLSG